MQDCSRDHHYIERRLRTSHSLVAQEKDEAVRNLPSSSQLCARIYVLRASELPACCTAPRAQFRSHNQSDARIRMPEMLLDGRVLELSGSEGKEPWLGAIACGFEAELMRLLLQLMQHRND